MTTKELNKFDCNVNDIIFDGDEFPSDMYLAHEPSVVAEILKRVCNNADVVFKLIYFSPEQQYIAEFAHEYHTYKYLHGLLNVAVGYAAIGFIKGMTEQK